MHDRGYQEPIRWKRDNLAAWRESHADYKHTRHDAMLRDIMNLAAEIPLLKEALDWAHAHDIEFIVDETTTAGAYYYVGAGVIGVSANGLRNPRTAVGYLVHEIRHAWQDHYHLIATVGASFPGYFMRLAMIEADATAHQKMAEKQYDIAMHIAEHRMQLEARKPHFSREITQSMLERSEREMASAVRDTDQYWKGFAGWFSSWKAETYGNSALRQFAHELGVPGVEVTDHHFEYNAYEVNPIPVEAGIDVTRMGDMRRLGKTFNNMNYFNADRERRVMLDFTAAAKADAFYTKETRDPLVDEVRRRWLGLKRHTGRDITLPAYC